jgi:hypothetical protein
MLYRLNRIIAFQGIIAPDQKMERPRLSHMGCVICRIFKLTLLFLRSLVHFWGVDILYIYWCDHQRAGMGLLEYQALPFFRDIAHDGWL